MISFSKARQFHKDFYDALMRSQAVIEFRPNGEIVFANDNFLKLMGYRLDEIKGRHHRIFVDDKTKSSQDYAQFWNNLKRGEFQSEEYKRITKSGDEVWIRATYNPIFDKDGQVKRIVKVASDITKEKLESASFQSQVQAINRSQAVIKFTLDGIILDANANFLTTMGYSLDEIKGKHHSIFVDPETRGSGEYQRFWDELRKGSFQQAEFRRVDKQGQPVWIQASYNPVVAPDGEITSVVKIATDITKQVRARERIAQVQAEIIDKFDRIQNLIERSTQQTHQVVEVVENTDESVQSAASGAEELAATARSIQTHVAQSIETTKRAVDEAEKTNTLVASLAESAKTIGEIINLITGVAEQTNLLALNATIEAARAGEAGKGFAVVASEVKGLATQTSKASEDISAQILHVQNVTQEAVQAIDAIRATIRNVSDISSGVADSIQEQTEVTSDITRKVQGFAHGMGSMSQAVRELNKLSRDIEGVSRDIQASAHKLG